jgi:hypothetical protein
MNRKLLMYGFFAFALSSTKASFAMNGPKALLNGSKLLSGAAIPAFAMAITYKKNEIYKENKNSSNPFKAQQEKFPVPANVKEFARGRMQLVGVHDAEKIPVVQSNKEYSSPCSVVSDCALFIRETEIKKLDEILRKEADGKKLDAEEVQTKDKMAMIISHESWHYMNEDCKTSIMVPMAGTIAVQGGSSMLSYAFNKAYNIQAPQTWKQARLRSLGAFAVLPLKAAIADWVELGVSREIETRADDFACKNAQSREALVAYQDFFKTRESMVKDATKINQFLMGIGFKRHYDDGDRAKEVQKYIEEWDKNHPKV